MAQNKFYKAYFLALFIFLTSCASSKFIVKSDPLQAEVFIVNPKTQEKKSLGKTPLEIPEEDLKKSVPTDITAGEFYTILVQKNGYEDQSFNIPFMRFSTLVSTLDVKMKEGKVIAEMRLAKDILDHMFLAQRFANSKEFERAHVEIDKVIQLYPDFARAYSMRASIYFAQKKMEDSLKWYEQAVKLDPNMSDAVKMIAKIKSGDLRTSSTEKQKNESTTMKN